MDTNTPPSPYIIMKRSKRVLDFDDEGKPLHPLIGKLSSINGKKGVGDLPRWGANFTVDAVVIDASGDIVLSTSSPSKGSEDPVSAALKSVRKSNRQLATVIKSKPCKIIYSNMNNFDARATENAWVETTVCLWKVPFASKQPSTHINPLLTVLLHKR